MELIEPVALERWVRMEWSRLVVGRDVRAERRRKDWRKGHREEDIAKTKMGRLDIKGRT